MEKSQNSARNNEQDLVTRTIPTGFFIFSYNMKSAFQHTVFYLLSLFFSIFLSTISFAQEMEYEKIKGDISNEVYDLHFDKNGLLWVGHAGGISSYDGRKFRHYYNPEQLSAGMTGLCEDSSGRIWCYNFSGQIWYVEKGRLHLLKAYQYKNEIFFPRIGIFKNQLIATSSKSLFVYDLNTKKARYIHLGSNVGSLSVLNDKVVDWCEKYWAIYAGMGKKVTLLKKRFFPFNKAAALTNVSLNNFMYLYTNPGSTVYKLKVNKQIVSIVDSIKTDGYINTISLDQNDIWIHSKLLSTTTNSRNTIKGLNISDRQTSKNGEIYLASLEFGILRKRNKRTEHIEITNQNNVVNNIKFVNHKIIAGTNKGHVLILDSSLSKLYYKDLSKFGSIENILKVDSISVFIAPSIGLVKFDTRNNLFSNIIENRTVKDVTCFDNNFIYSTTTSIIYQFEENAIHNYEWMKKNFPSFNLRKESDIFFYSDPIRSRSSCIINDSILLISSINCINIITKTKSDELVFEKKQITGNSFLKRKDRIYFSNNVHGLFIWEYNRLRRINTTKDLKIFKLKFSGSDILIFSLAGIFNFNPQTEQLKRLNLIDIPHNTILDIEKINNDYLIATSEGLIKIPILIQPSDVQLSAIPVFCTVNQSDTITKNFFKLSHSENDLIFFYSAPWYGAKEDIEIIYRLTHNQKGFWQTTTAEEDFLHFPSLEPGNYSLEVKVRNRHTEKESNPATWNFVIRKPWWELLIARIFFGFVLGMVVYISIRRVYQKKLEKQFQIIEKQQAVLNERKRIAADMHDELGAGISSLQLMSEISALNTNETDIKDELAKINLTAKDLGNKVREIVWTLNPQNDSLENLLFFINKYGHEFFSKTKIHFKCILPESIPDIIITGGCRHHIVLMVKEIFNNIVKHANASEVSCTFSVEHEFEIRIHDNGKGFGKQEASGNGLKNIEERIKFLSGTWELDTQNGVSVHLQIPFQNLKNDLDT